MSNSRNVMSGKEAGLCVLGNLTNSLVIGDRAGYDGPKRDTDYVVLIGDDTIFLEEDNTVVIGTMLWGEPIDTEFKHFLESNIENIRRLLNVSPKK